MTPPKKGFVLIFKDSSETLTATFSQFSNFQGLVIALEWMTISVLAFFNPKYIAPTI